MTKKRDQKKLKEKFEKKKKRHPPFSSFGRGGGAKKESRTLGEKKDLKRGTPSGGRW